MKKAWKWLLTAVGIPVVCFGLLAADSYYRAVAAIAAHDARLAKDIAAFRSRFPAAPSGPGILEGGHSGLHTPSNALSQAIVIADNSSATRILLVMSNAEIHLREGGYDGSYHRFQFENEALQELRSRLTMRRYEVRDLREIAGELKRVRAARATFADVIAAEHLLDRAEVLAVLRLKRDPHVIIRRPPGWRELFSWRILIAKTLLQLDDLHKEVLPLSSLPAVDREAAADAWAAFTEKEGVLARTGLRIGASRVLSRERMLVSEWELTRVAVTLALFQAERGKDPHSLEQLVPDYFPELPVSPADGKPYRFKDGLLFDRAARSEWRLPFTR